jgi:hypothetical protein
MAALIMEIFGLLNAVAAIYYWTVDKTDIYNWLFYLLMSVIMYINASRYDKESE